MNTFNNQRSLSTNNRIEHGFLQLLPVKGIDKISVSELCKNVEICRSSFYLHYCDIYDLMQKIEVTKQEGIYNIFRAEDSQTLMPLTNDKLDILIDYIFENADYYRIFLCDLDNVIAIAKAISRNQSEMKHVDYHNLPKDFRINIYNKDFKITGLIVLVRNWLSQECFESPDEFKQMLLDRLDLQ